MKHSEYSVIIIGSGVAGLYAALKIAKQIALPDGVLIITKDSLGESNSKYAQGGIVGVMTENSGDSVASHVSDTLKAGAGLSDNKNSRYISQMSDCVINDLISTGVQFDRDKEGKLNYTLEAAHSFRRILHVGGDATGKGITEALRKAVLANADISVMENSMAVELLINSYNECKGVVIYNELTNEHEIVYSSSTILATGGAGQLYKYTTNPVGATADGIDLAYNAGAILRDLEFVQFHPTALAIKGNKNRFLISEAVRGEGAKLVNSAGNEFMQKYSDKRELAPRDIVTRAIYHEMQEAHTENMFLNASFIDKAKLTLRFPTISKICLKSGIDISQTPIPVAPAAHYYMGGIKADVNGKTSVNGLYAIGEVASTGLHGANRLASNSLLECVVCAYELADYLSFANLATPKFIDNKILETIHIYGQILTEKEQDVEQDKQELKTLMWNNVGILRNAESLNNAIIKITNLKQKFNRNRKCLNRAEYEYRNMLTVAELIAQNALDRNESRGAHARTDYKETLPVGVHSECAKSKSEEFSYA